MEVDYEITENYELHRNIENRRLTTLKIKHIMEHLHDKSISESVKTRAELIYNRLNIGNLKMPNKIRPIAYCVYVSSIEVNDFIPADIVARMFSLTNRIMSSSIATYKAKDPDSKVYSNIELLSLKYYCKITGMQREIINEIAEHFKADKDILEDFIDDDTNKALLSYIILYCEQLGYDNVDPQVFKEMFDVNLKLLIAMKTEMREQLYL